MNKVARVPDATLFRSSTPSHNLRRRTRARFSRGCGSTENFILCGQNGLKPRETFASSLRFISSFLWISDRVIRWGGVVIVADASVRMSDSAAGGNARESAAIAEDFPRLNCSGTWPWVRSSALWIRAIFRRKTSPDSRASLRSTTRRFRNCEC